MRSGTGGTTVGDGTGVGGTGLGVGSGLTGTGNGSTLIVGWAAIPPAPGGTGDPCCPDALHALNTNANARHLTGVRRNASLSAKPRLGMVDLTLTELGADHESLSVVPDGGQPHAGARDQRDGWRVAGFEHARV
jgi:hypothetical protein